MTSFDTTQLYREMQISPKHPFLR